MGQASLRRCVPQAAMGSAEYVLAMQSPSCIAAVPVLAPYERCCLAATGLVEKSIRGISYILCILCSLASARVRAPLMPLQVQARVEASRHATAWAACGAVDWACMLRGGTHAGTQRPCMHQARPPDATNVEAPGGDGGGGAVAGFIHGLRDSMFPRAASTPRGGGGVLAAGWPERAQRWPVPASSAC